MKIRIKNKSLGDFKIGDIVVLEHHFNDGPWYKGRVFRIIGINVQNRGAEIKPCSGPGGISITYLRYANESEIKEYWIKRSSEILYQTN